MDNDTKTNVDEIASKLDDFEQTLKEMRTELKQEIQEAKNRVKIKQQDNLVFAAFQFLVFGICSGVSACYFHHHNQGFGILWGVFAIISLAVTGGYINLWWGWKKLERSLNNIAKDS